MTIEITTTDYFYKEGEQYEVSENIRWGCYIVEDDRSLIRVCHAKEVVKPCSTAPSFHELASKGIQCKQATSELSSEWYALKRKR